MNPRYKKLMTHRVTITKLIRNIEGDWAVDETFTNIPSFCQWGQKIVADKMGENVTATAIIFLQDDAPINDDDHYQWKITQTEPYTRAEVTVLSIDPIDDPRTGNTHHFECLVK